MKLDECLKIGYSCGLSTIGEAYNNVALHYSNLFIIDEAPQEMQELIDDIEGKKIKWSELVADYLSKHDMEEIDNMYMRAENPQ